MVTADEARRELARRELARRRAPSAQAQPSQFEDVVASGASGVARGTADLVGLPGSIGDLMRSGGQFAMRKGYELATGNKPSQEGGMVERFFAGNPELEAKMIGGGSNPLSGGNIRKVASAVTGGATDYQPYTRAGKYARTAGEFLPGAAAFGGGSVANLARYGAIPALTSETAGQLTEDTSLEPYARVAGALLGGIAGSKIGAPKAPKVSTAAEIKKSAGYGDDMTEILRQAQTTDKTYKGIVSDLWDDVRQAGTSYDVQQNFGRTLQNELKMVQKEGASLHSLERLRRALRSAGGGTLDTPNQAIATRLIDKLDDAVDSLSASNIAQSGQTGKPVLEMLKEARQAYRTGMKSQIIEDAIKYGREAKSGAENGLRGEFTKILKSDKKLRNFTQAEQDAIRQVARGNFTSNALRFLGTFGFPIDQGRNWLGAIGGSTAMGGLAGSAFGPGVGTAVGSGLALGGTAAKIGASRATDNLARIAEAMVKAGPGGSQKLADALMASRSAGKEAILRALLQSQSAARIPNATVGVQ